MKIFLILCLLIPEMIISNSEFAVSKGFIENLKKLTTWEVSEFDQNIFKHWTIEEVSKILNKVSPKKDNTKKIEVASDSYKGSYPPQFDARDKWPNCIHPAMDQGNCSASWAFSVSGFISDNYCIKNGQDILLSPQDPISCDYENYGCSGGYLDITFKYFEDKGGVTLQCFNYSSQSGKPPKCIKECQNSSIPYKKYGCISKSTFSIGGEFDKMKNYLYNNGTLVTRMEVFQDFLTYKSGIYYHTTGHVLGAQDVKLIGYGHDDSIGWDYWICENSWGENWGMKGFFMILEGNCDIDGNAIGCTTKSF